jgi:hypothetical protein
LQRIGAAAEAAGVCPERAGRHDRSSPSVRVKPPQARRRSGNRFHNARRQRIASKAHLAKPGAHSWLARRPSLSFSLIRRRPSLFATDRARRIRAGRGQYRTSVNTHQQCRKACWGQPLKSSKLLSSAIVTSGATLRRPRQRSARATPSLIRGLAGGRGWFESPLDRARRAGTPR